MKNLLARLFQRRGSRGALADVATWTPREFACLRSHLGMYAMEPETAQRIHDDIVSGRVLPVRDTDDLAEIQAQAYQKIDVDPGPDIDDDDTRDDDEPPASGAKRVAVITIDGTLMKHWSKYGGTSTNFLRSALADAASDRSVDAIMLWVDSPGGLVVGTDQTYEAVKAANEAKPTHVYVDDHAFSAAYYIAAGAGHIAAQPTAEIGSIGTLAIIDDVSGMYEKEGVKTRVIRSSPRKAMIVDGEAVSDEAIAQYKPSIDRAATRFVEQVATGRGLDTPELGKGWATGDWWSAEEAKALGLIDAVMSFDEAMTHLVSSIDERRGGKTRSGKTAAAAEQTGGEPETEGGVMDPRLKAALSALGLGEDASEADVANALNARPAPKGHVVIKEDEWAALKARVEASEQRAKERDAEAAVHALIHAKGGPRIVKAQVEWAKSFYLSAGKDAFDAWAATLYPIVGTEANGVLTGDSEDVVNVGAIEKKLDKLIAEHAKANDCTLQEATDAVYEAHPELVEQLDAATAMEVK